jgi:PAS domain S-box-containing protein
MEESLQASEERERLILNSIPDAMFGIDQHGQFTFCNTACLYLLGYRDPADLLGQSAHTLLHPMNSEDRPVPIEDCQFCQAMLRGELTHFERENFLDGSNNIISVECWIRPLLQGNIALGSVATIKKLVEEK